MLFWVLVAFAGGAGCVLFGVPMLMDAVYGAQFKKKSGMMPGLIRRSIKKSVKPFLVSAAVLVLALVMMAVASRRPVPKTDPEGSRPPASVEFPA